MAASPDEQGAVKVPEPDSINLTIHHHGKQHHLTFAQDATLSDLSSAIESDLSVPLSSQKLMITPKPGLLKPPFSEKQLATPLEQLAKAKIILMGSTAAQTASLEKAVEKAHAPPRASPIPRAKPTKRIDSKRAQEDAMYTFQRLEPLPHMPRPERSLEFLHRLKEDAGIRAAMRKWKWSVPLLTEMDPAAHTTHSYDGVSRTLGLNRNAGQVIELRLRTDAGDGYRDYKTIRKTLCHELAHNVWGDHDQNFWALCREIEVVVDKEDWTRGGRSVGGSKASEVYIPDDEGWEGDEDQMWQGGAQKLGGSGRNQGVSMRDALARAAEERAKRDKEKEKTERSTDDA